MLDVLIRGGTVIDGTGAPARRADVGITNGKIVEIGRINERAAKVIDADGAIVTPGFIDIHTHYDGQYLWDDKLDPSFSHGVTSVIAGNCGVGFAPVGTYKKELVELMEGVEDIPEAVITEGLKWDWNSFPDYLDRVAERNYSMDVASMIGHGPMRVFVMGERALRHESATAEDVNKMCGLVRDAMAAGALGVSSNRLLEHLSIRGNHVPGTFAGDDEILALARTMGASGRGTFQTAAKGALGAALEHGLKREERLEEHHKLAAIARVSGRPVTFGAVEFASDPEDLWMMIRETDKCVREGVQVRVQIPSRGLGNIHMLDTYHVFLMKPSYREIAHLPAAARAAAMRDPARRKAILTEADVEGDYAKDPRLLGILRLYQRQLASSYIVESPIDFEPGPERNLEVLARSARKTMEEYVYDHYSSGDGHNMSLSFFFNYLQGNLDHIEKVMHNPNVLSGLGDGGAHVRMLLDASYPTFNLIFWGRERRRGKKLPVELIVHKMTGAAADLFGFADRGRLEVGRRADVNVIDFNGLTLEPVRLERDLPSGAGRLLQNSQGYLATLVAGEPTRLQDQDTGARPGRLVRAGR
jgi:N-acyl-D-aspartate/D-glutamate deacylase